MSVFYLNLICISFKYLDPSPQNYCITKTDTFLQIILEKPAEIHTISTGFLVISTWLQTLKPIQQHEISSFSSSGSSSC